MRWHNLYKTLNLHVWWSHLCRNILNLLEGCVIFKKNAAKHKPHNSVLLIVDHAPFEKGVLDFVGPMPKAKRGKEFLITAIYVSTPWPVAWAVEKYGQRRDKLYCPLNHLPHCQT